MGRFAAAVCVLAGLSRLPGCASSSAEPGAPPAAQEAPLQSVLLEEVNREHQAIQKPEVDFSAYIGQYAEDGGFDLQSYAARSGVDYGEVFQGDAPLTPEQAEEGLDVLFRALRTTYGPYAYLGGDQVFDQAKEAVLQGCLEAEELTCNTLVSRLLDGLSFLPDAHFRIMGMPVSQPVAAYFYRETAYEKTNGGYKSLPDGKPVVSVDGWEDLDELFRRSLDEDGRVVYYPVVLQAYREGDDALPAPVTVRYEDGSAQTLTASPYQSFYDEDGEAVRLTENQGVPVLFARNMGFDEARDDTIGKAFLAYAEEFREEPVVILDLRSNGGGNSVLPFKWLAAYTGEPVTTNYVSLQYLSEQDLQDFGENRDNPYYISYETMTEVAGYAPIPGSEEYTQVNAQPDAFADNENLLIVLTGKNTGSAAETFVDMVHNVRNTLVIGENTYGVLTSNAYTAIELPNSHAHVQLGSDLSIFPEEDGYFQEFVGFRPDLWTSAGDAEELAVRLVQRLRRENG